MNRNSKPHLTVIEPNAAETISNEPDAREEEAPAEPFQPTEAHAAAAQPEMSLFEACRSVFGDARVLEGRPDDRQFPPELPRRSGADPASTETIGVRCGAGAEGHLVAVVLSDAELARDFQTRNPTLYQVLTRWESSTLVWLRVGDPAPRNLNTGIVIWISEGVIPLEDPPVATAPIPLTRFERIQWDPTVRAAFDAEEVERMFGESFLPTGPRKFVFNDLSWSELLIRKFGLRFDLNQKGFCRYDAKSGMWLAVSRGEVRRLVANRLIQLARDLPAYFPPWEVTQARVGRLLWLMENLAATCLPDARQGLDLFFDLAVEASEGAGSTTEEFYNGYVTFCRVRKLPLLSKASFEKQAARRLGQAAHCFGENGTQRGRSGWRLKLEVISDPGIGVPGAAAGLEGSPAS